MARLPFTDYTEMKIRLSRDQRQRLEKHARAVGRTMVDIARDAIDERLNFLDEKEKSRKQSKSSLAHVPRTVEHPWGKPQGLGPRNKAQAPQEPPASPFAALHPDKPYQVPDKVKNKFRSWAEYLEEADGIVDTERHVKKIVEDIRGRVTGGDKEVEACYRAFVEFCDARKASKEPSTFSIGNDVPITGDV